MERPGHHCSVCNKTFTEKSNLTKHRKNHFAKENWVCDVCSKSFTTKSSLNIHQKQHQYPHICLYRRGEARLQCTDAAKSVAQVPSKVEDPTWLDPKKAEAAAKISGGELWKGQLVITFGKYAGQTFRWLLENDVGWLVRLLFEYCQKGEKNELLMWQKERLLEYAREFPPVTLHLDRRLKKQQSKKETAESTISEVQQHPNYASDAELLAAADLEKACDRVPREELCYCMRKSGVTEKYVGAVQDMYEGCKTVVSVL
ncbi:Zinc finger protein 182 [Collichthys lucidus]|uniref:Zinc finger protein 182 n=1 Tax=Collichthys lucidus TaxID=240159 RepID=A0A4U5TWA7_COLLU|nr:Zinc finger protein 182 [Collichthys lucidus]